jgi:hypothetical protein
MSAPWGLTQRYKACNKGTASEVVNAKGERLFELVHHQDQWLTFGVVNQFQEVVWVDRKPRRVLRTPPVRVHAWLAL